jgi:hypothetical protein
MSKVALSGNASGTGTFTIASPNGNTDRTLTLPDQTGTLLTGSGAISVNASAPVPSVTVDASGNLLVGTTSASVADSGADNLVVGPGTGNNGITVYSANTGNANLNFADTDSPTVGFIQYQHNGNNMIFQTNGSERARIDSSGNLLVGTTNATLYNQGAGVTGLKLSSNTQMASTGTMLDLNNTSGGGINAVNFWYRGSGVGNILVNTSSTAYNTSSDYRLKEDVQPMTGALAKVAALKPVTYKWKSTGDASQGFIAHELQAVVPECVSGEKDATRIEQYEISPAVPATFDEDGNELTPAVEAVMGEREVPAYQGIDTSFLVATLTAAIQELKAIVDAQGAEIAALKGQA